MIESMLAFLQARLNVQSDEGAALVEYGLLVALIAVVCIGAVTGVGTAIAARFGDVVTAL
jgi:pilus assembly protein Flp/PilA